MWMPTHVQVTVQRAEGLLLKGKHDTNDSFVTIALGKTKYRTSIKEKSGKDVEWREECELPIPDQGNTAEIILTALHQNFLGVDEFLGRVVIPLNDLDIYERPKNRWYTLQSKPGKEKKDKDRGRLEVKIAFTVKSGSLTSLAKDNTKLSVSSQISNAVGGSLMSLRSAEKRKGLKKLAKSIGSKMNLSNKGEKKQKKKKINKDGSFDEDSSSMGSSMSSLQTRGNLRYESGQIGDEADPGVISEDDDEFTFDELSHKSSHGSVNRNPPTIKVSVEEIPPPSPIPKVNVIPPPKPPRDEWDSKLSGGKTTPKTTPSLRPRSIENLNRHSWDFSAFDSQIEDLTKVPPPIPENLKQQRKITPDNGKNMFSKFKNLMKMDEERVIIGKENQTSTGGGVSSEILRKFEGKTREELIAKICDCQDDVEKYKKKLRDLEDYLDELLLRVMETQPRILQNPYIDCKFEHRNISEF